MSRSKLPDCGLPYFLLNLERSNLKSLYLNFMGINVGLIT